LGYGPSLGTAEPFVVTPVAYTRSMADRGNRPAPVFDRATAEGRRAEMAYLDNLDEAELDAYDRGHRYVTANPATTPEREAHLAKQLADINTSVTDA
jgi:hypothetical protein